MTFLEGVIALFGMPPLPGSRCEVLIDNAWRPVPLEWNTTLRLADILGCEARMLDSGGDTFRKGGK